MPFSTYTNLGLGDLAHTRLTIELADRIIKYPKGIAKNVLVRIGEAESFDPYYGDYIELNDLDMPLEPRMNRDNEFEPTINECIIVNEPTKQILLQNDEDDHGGNELAETLIDMPIFVGNFSIISGFTIIDDMDRTSGVVLGMPLCKKFVSCQKTIEKFARRDECQRLKDE
ncbi:hypothetical protein Tco_1555939 [Tanacetum coccineum]